MRLAQAIPPESDLLRECKRHAPEVLIVSDPALSRPDLSRLLVRLDAELPQLKVLVLTEWGQISPDEAIQAGAWGYLTPEAPPELLPKAIRSIAAGEVWAPRVTLSKLARQSRRKPVEASGGEPPLLSERELEVLRLVAEGRDNVSIGAGLHVEVSTIKTHLVRIYRKLGVGDRSSAVRAAEELGLIRSPAKR
jgi:DNA-binding NarL/FixJ family response regulator